MLVFTRHVTVLKVSMSNASNRYRNSSERFDLAHALVRFQFHLANATGIEVFSLGDAKTAKFQILVGYSPDRRSHEVRRILALRDRFRASWRRGQCSAHPA